MKRNQIERFTCSAAVACVALGLPAVATTAHAAISGASYYTNLLDNATVTEHKLINTPAVIMNVNSPLTDAHDGGFGTYGRTAANTSTSYANNGPAYFQWGLPSGTFAARTFISVQAGTYAYVPGSPPTSGFSTSSPYQLSANTGGGGTYVDLAGHSSTGSPLLSPFVITSSTTPVVASAVRVTFDELYETGGNGYATMGEVIAVEDTLVRVPIDSGSASSTLGGYPVTQAFDDNSHLGWAAGTGAAGVTLTLNLGAERDIGALLIGGSVSDLRSERFDIYFNGSATPAVTDVGWGATALNSALIKLDDVAQGVTSITLQFTAQSVDPGNGNQVHWINEVIPFEITPVPEPASAALIVLGGVAMLARRR